MHVIRGKKIEQLFTAEMIAKRMDELAGEIAAGPTKDLLVIAILKGSFIFAAINVAIYAGLCVFLLIRHATENGLPKLPALRGGATAAACSLLLAAGSAVELSSHAIGGLEALSHGQPYVSFTETRFTVAGAGVEGARSVRLKLRITVPGLREPQEMQAEPIVTPPPAVAPGEIMLADNRVGQ